MNEDNSYHTISKTSDIVGVQSHVLRFWEKKFHSINPKKSLSGRRYYSSNDIEVLLRIKKLLYEEGFTIKGAVNLIDKQNDVTTLGNVNSLNIKINKITNLLKEGSKLITKNMY